MTQNLNWPYMDVAVSFSSGTASGMPAPYWCSVKGRTLGQIATNRGRQYELDQVQTGTWTGSLENTDAALDPANTSSPFYPNVLPYRMFRHRAQYPATINMLTADQATALYASQGSSPSGLPAWVTTSGGAESLSCAYSSTIGTNYYNVGINASAQFQGVLFSGFSITPGATYTAQCQANSANGVTAGIYLDWRDCQGNHISYSSGAITALAAPPARTQLTVTGTAPANAAGAMILVQNTTVIATATTMALWNIQVEQNSSASAWVQPGTWYSVFTGYVERWPQSWNANGQFGLSNLTVVDAFGYLSQTKLLSCAYMEMLAAGPDFLFPLDEPSGNSLFYDLTAKLAPAGILVSQGGSAAQVAPGDSLKTNLGLLPQGIGGPAVLFSNQSSSYAGYASVALPTSPPELTSSGWTRTFAFRCTSTAWPGAGAEVTLWDIRDDYGNSVRFDGVQSGPLSVLVSQNATSTYSSGTGLTSICDSNWHQVILTCSSDGKTFSFYFDGTLINQQTLASDGRPSFAGQVWDQVGADVYNYQGASNGYSGDIALVAQYPFPLTASQVSQIYSAFRYGGSGWGVASSTTRYQDILRWGKWQGLQYEDNYPSGECVAYGPATELAATAADTGTDVVTALQTVVDTDAGTHYVAADGTVTFRARRARYNQNTPVVIFGEHSGEVPYTTVQTGYDPTRLANDISIIQTQTNQTQRVTNLASAQNFGDIQLQRNVNTLNPYEQNDAAQYLALRNSTPVQRVEGISVNVGANPAVWAAMLGLELGSRVRMMRRPPLGAATIQVDGFVEQINWSFDDKGNAGVTLQVSVNNQQQYWQLDSSTYSVLDSTTIVGY